MSRTGGALAGAAGAAVRWGLRYLLWFFIAAGTTLGGAGILMLAKDWSFASVATAVMAWPAAGLAAILAGFAAFLPLGRFYLGTALALGALYNLVLLST